MRDENGDHVHTWLCGKCQKLIRTCKCHLGGATDTREICADCAATTPKEGRGAMKEFTKEQMDQIEQAVADHAHASLGRGPCQLCDTVELIRSLRWRFEQLEGVNKQCERCHKFRPVLEARRSPIGMVCENCFDEVKWDRVEEIDQQLAIWDEAGKKLKKERKKLIGGES